MCGIFFYYSNLAYSKDAIIEAASHIQHRGPDNTKISSGNNYTFVFHRLAINGMTELSDQPFYYPSEKHAKYILVCNGEIYNYKDLIVEHNIHDYKSSSDCEIILHLYEIYRDNLHVMLQKLKGVFAFTLLDIERNTLMIARDPFGVRSLYHYNSTSSYGVASELKALYPLTSQPYTIEQFPAAHFSLVNLENMITSTSPYYCVWENAEINNDSKEVVMETLKSLLMQAVSRRTLCDRKTSEGLPAIGAYLSGGFDSSTIAALLAKIYPGKLHTFSIGFKDAPDLIAARTVADHIGSHHHEVIVTEDEMIEQWLKTPKIIESYDTTTNRASSFMIKLSSYIAEQTDIAVVYSGEGSDEMFGSYLYFRNAPSDEAFHNETLRLLSDLQYFDLLRGDKSSACAGLEIRVPFLDIDLVNYVKTISPSLKMRDYIEKYILRKTVESMNVLPKEICWRTKEAMSDGVSLYNRSWSKIIQSYCYDKMGKNNGVLCEKEMLLKNFTKEYYECEETIPYEWLPKWCGIVNDSSARTLSVYSL